MHPSATRSIAPGAVQAHRVRAVARGLQTAERAVMGLVLVGLGASGVLSALPEAVRPDAVPQIGGSLMQAGFVYPLLKGVDVLLDLYVGWAGRRDGHGPSPEGAASTR